MAINVSQPFHRTSANAVDDTLTLTKAQMKSVNDNLMPAKYLTVCQDDGAIYLYDKTNTVDSTTGKFRIFEGGSEIDDTTTAADKVWSSSKVNTTKQDKTLANSVTLAGQTVTNIESAVRTLANLYTIGTISTDSLGGNSSSHFNKTDYSQIGNTKVYMYKWSAGSSHPYSAGVPTWFSYPAYDVNYLLITYRNTDDTQIDEVAWCFYTESSVNKVRHFSRRCTKSGSTWTFPDWSEVGELPVATSSVLGGVKIGENMLIENGVINPSYTIVANKFNKSDIYSTTEKVIGCWTDGRPIYQKNINFNLPSKPDPYTENQGIEQNYPLNLSISSVVDAQILVLANTTWPVKGNNYTTRILSDGTLDWFRWGVKPNTATTYANHLVFQWHNTSSLDTAFFGCPAILILRYTKTTDAANSFKYADENDYSTSEKIIGSWVDGKILYQKTIQTTMPECTVDETTGVTTVGISYVSVGANVDYFVSGQLALKSSSNACVLSIPYVPNTQAYQVTALNTWQNGIAIPCTRITGFTNTVSSNKNTIRIENAMPGHNGAAAYITVKYTKV